ncbi:hypothetical protein RYZ26_09070 [Terasakiella sp. A23]|uniref:hypothetical protein n=1 Tax=Terasakiella sp. FCG-A23 TaxID=3080561 RepID=UPI00295576BA|nr:hypothetical protein [Terasakiella sp. A23]MDV7339743.1 hypothetical protein [Terasakiella sp. A23]
MLKTLAVILLLQSSFFVASSTGQAANSDMSPIFEATEKLMDQEVSQLFGTHNQAALLDYMKKHGDQKGVARLSAKLSARNSTEKEVGSYTFLEAQVAKAEIFLGQIEKANHRVETALNYAPTLWLSHGNDRPFNSYIDLMGIYLETGGDIAGLKQARLFLDKVATRYREDDWRHQLFQSLGRMWAKAGYISNARENFQKAIDVALTFPSEKGRQNKRMNYLMSIASFQGRLGFYEDMAKTISLVDTTDGEALNAAWETIKGTIDLLEQPTVQ